MRLLDRLFERSTGITSVDDLAEWFSLNGIQYPLYGHSSGTTTETLDHSYEGYIGTALKGNGIVFACVAARLMLFSEVQFTWQDVSNGNLFTDEGLAPLQTPSASRTTQEMLALMELDASFAGNSFWVRDGAGLRRLRPDWVGIVAGDPKRGQRSTDLLGYTYTDGGAGQGELEIYLPSEVAHYSPYPDPTAAHKGMSWLTPILREVVADSRFTAHRDSVAKRGGVHTGVVSYPPLGADQFKEAVEGFRQMYEGPSNSGKWIHVSGGADVTPMTMDLRSMDFKSVQGGGETRIAAASRVPAVIAGISEGLAGSSLNQGNYGMARRQLADLYARPSWRSACGALETLVSNPRGSTRLWYDESLISFLREDQRDAAEVLGRQSEAIVALVRDGFDPMSAVEAINGGDLSKLVHTDLVSVQLQAPGSTPTPALMPAASTN